MVVPLAVAGAFHTSFMEPAVELLRLALKEADIRQPRIPVISNVDAKPHGSPDEIREMLAKQVTNPVQWETIMMDMVKSSDWINAGHQGCKSYEVGPGMVCRGIVKKLDKNFNVVNVRA
jgi:[acyl-carrier-protein] S-malonyltransferase